MDFKMFKLKLKTIRSCLPEQAEEAADQCYAVTNEWLNDPSNNGVFDTFVSLTFAVAVTRILFLLSDIDDNMI